MDDQPLAVMRKMEVALYAYDAFKARQDAGSVAEFYSKHRDLDEFCRMVDEWRV